MNLVMVPPPFTVTNGSVMGNGNSAKIYNPDPDVIVYGGGARDEHSFGKVQSLSTYDTFHYDPMPDYKDWYGFPQLCHYTNFDEVSINSKMWDRSELNQWLSENIHDTILVQKIWPYWMICFKTEAEYESFMSWWEWKVKEEQMFIPVPLEYQGRNYEFLRELKSWCELNLTDQYELVNFSDRIKCAIRDQQEAVMFRLRWSEPTNPQL